jgi:predicted nucleic acid-binding protein
VIVVDSSVWISWLRQDSKDSSYDLSAIDPLDILLGDLILWEVLQGAKSSEHARNIERRLQRFGFVNMLDRTIAVRAAENYRALRSIGITIRKTSDLIIGTFCIVHGHALLHTDRDFFPMAEHLGLRLV